jgi:putative transposase
MVAARDAPVGFPRFKKGRARDACRFTTGAIKVLSDRKHVQLPKIGVLKTHESTRKLAPRLEKGSARIIAATISRQADRWFVSFTVEVERRVPASNGMANAVGVDVGIRHLAVLSTGAVIANPRALENRLRKIRRLNRQLARCTSESKRGKRTRRLARALADAGLAELRRQLTYKTAWYGSRLVVADRFYPSSKTCSACSWVKAKLSLSEHAFRCARCGLVIDRDLNAARNLTKLIDHVARSGRETINARAADISPRRGRAGRVEARSRRRVISDGTAPSVRKHR